MWRSFRDIFLFLIVFFGVSSLDMSVNDQLDLSNSSSRLKRLAYDIEKKKRKIENNLGLFEQTIPLENEQGVAIKGNDGMGMKYTDKNQKRSKLEPVIKQDVPEVYEFRTHTLTPNNTLMFSGVDMKITSKVSKDVRIRYCPPGAYDDLTKHIREEEGLFPGAPIIQFENFESVMEDTCIYIRHNVENWRKYENFNVRCYKNLQHPLKYIDIEAEMFEDYIRVCGPLNKCETYETKEHGSTFDSNHYQLTNNRRESGRSDEGFGQQDDNSQLRTCTIVPVVRPEYICDISIYFSREVHENMCPQAHSTSVYAVLNKKSKITEFLERELGAYSMEEAAQRIRVSVCRDQIYNPIIGVLGESTNENLRKMIWEDSSSFSSFSYNELNQKRGFIKIQKIPPPLQLFCDRRNYYMMKLKVSNGIPPEDSIYEHGANIVPISCQKFREMRLLLNNAPSCSFTSNSPSISMEITAHEGATTPIVEIEPDEVVVRPSNNIEPVDSNSQQPKNTSETENASTYVNTNSRKRRRKEEIEKAEGSSKCTFCPATLSRKQTLREHMKKFHPQNIPVEKGKENTSIPVTLCDTNIVNLLTKPESSTVACSASNLLSQTLPGYPEIFMDDKQKFMETPDFSTMFPMNTNDQMTNGIHEPKLMLRIEEQKSSLSHLNTTGKENQIITDLHTYKQMQDVGEMQLYSNYGNMPEMQGICTFGSEQILSDDITLSILGENDKRMHMTERQEINTRSNDIEGMLTNTLVPIDSTTQFSSLIF